MLGLFLDLVKKMPGLGGMTGCHHGVQLQCTSIMDDWVSQTSEYDMACCGQEDFLVWT